MSTHPLAGQPAPDELIINVPRLMAAYYTEHPDPTEATHRVTFGTSGHRGSAFDTSFNEDHILAIAQAVAEYRAGAGVNGPLYIGKDTHALSEAALITVVEVLNANNVSIRIDEQLGYTPTPVVSHAILVHNRRRSAGLADGIIITPSHNPPRDGGIKYNATHGGPAEDEITKWIQNRANALLENGLSGVKRIPFARALASDNVEKIDYVTPYVEDLAQVLDMDAISRAGLLLGVDPMGGAGIDYWEPIAERYGLSLELVNRKIDPTFSFMRVDRDGKLRMDCSSPWAMAGLIDLKERFDVAFGNDPDYDRHGIITRGSGLLNPNHYLAVAIQYLFSHREQWSGEAAVGKTLVSSSMIDRVAGKLGRRLAEVPVGFKWFVNGLASGNFGFGGEESAGASFLRKNGTVWSTDKDGILLDLLAAEITAVTGKDPGEHYRSLEAEFGSPVYARTDAPASLKEKAILKKLNASQVLADELAGETITAKLTEAPGNGAAIGGLKVTAESGWFAARPSGTENIYKIYAESFKGDEHLQQLQAEAKEIVSQALAAGS